MWYDRGYENPSLHPTLNRGRTQSGADRIALVRRLCTASLPDPAGVRTRRTSGSHRHAVGLPQTDGTHGHPRLQCQRARRLRRRLLASPSSAHDVFRRGVRGTARLAPPQPPRLWQTDQPVDTFACRPGQLRARSDAKARLRRERASRAGPPGHELEARQTLDHQPRSAIPTKKNARDRLISYASQQPDWAIGFLDEVWWSRFALPRVQAWQSKDRPVRLVEQVWQKGDPDPKALACYGVLWQKGAEQEPDRSELWLRFVTGRPVSAMSILFLDWCCECLEAQGKRNWLLIWDNASWHKSLMVRTWIREHNQLVKNSGKGVRILPFLLPTKSPWLNPIEPKWVHAKKHIVEPDGLLSAKQLAERICAHFGCSYEPHLALVEKVA